MTALAVYHEHRCKAKTLHWDDMPVQELTEWVEKNYPRRGSRHQGAQTWHDQPPHPAWKAWVHQAFEDAGFGPVEQYKYWLSILDHDSRRDRTNPDYVEGFPHKHSWPHGVTLVLMVQPATEGGETIIIEDDGAEHVLSMQTGDAVMIGGEIEHGVKRITQLGERLVLIATAYVAKGIEWDLQ